MDYLSTLYLGYVLSIHYSPFNLETYHLDIYNLLYYIIIIAYHIFNLQLDNVVTDHSHRMIKLLISIIVSRVQEGM